MSSGIVLNIQRFSLHDGDGIRTTVFLKGCGLRCVWCHNPEAMLLQPQMSVDGKMLGVEMTVDQVIAAVEKDRRYYENSGGGLTLSGGEPLFQFTFARDLLTEAKRRGLHICLDTAGDVPQSHFASVLPLVDVFLYDIKAHTPEQHQRLTGVENKRILANLEFLYASGAAITLRCPLIPGINDTPDHLAWIASLARRYPNLRGIDIMPFHNMAAGKWRAIGKTWTLGDLPNASEADRARWLETLRACGYINIRL